MRKSDLKKFPCGSEDVCRIENGSANAYLRHDRVVEGFLKFIEPNYNKALRMLRSGKADEDTIFVISGFVSFVSSCAPAAMRIHAEPLKRLIEAETELVEAKEACCQRLQNLEEKQ